MDPATVVRGLVAGLAATGVMTLVELAARSYGGLEALLDWQVNQVTAARILKRRADELVLAGIGFHFLHGLVAGLVFVLALPFAPAALPTWLLGIGYGVVLLAITMVVHKPMTRRMPASWRLRPMALGVGFLAHAAYGTALALLIVWP